MHGELEIEPEKKQPTERMNNENSVWKEREMGKK